MGKAIAIEVLLECSECGAILHGEIDDTLEPNMLHCSVDPCYNCGSKAKTPEVEDEANQ